MSKLIKLSFLPLLSIFLLSLNSNKNEINIENRKNASSIEVIEGEELDYSKEFYDDFSSGIDSSKWGVVEKVWGNEDSNSGVRHENVFIGANGLSFRALGDYYTENEFVNTNSGAKYTDGKRSGGVIASKDTYGPGRYEIKTRIPSIPGAAYAFWGYLNSKIDEVKYYNEIDFEFPVYSYIENSNARIYSFDKVYLSTYTDDVGDSTKSTLYPSLTDVIGSIADGEYHTLTFDWIYSKTHKQVSYYIDGKYVGTNTKNVSGYDMHVYMGIWISGNEHNFGLPNFDKAFMDVKYFSYIPFKNQVNTKIESTLTDYVDEYMKKTADEEFVTRNMLPNSHFNEANLTGYIFDETKIEISSEYDAGGNSESNGVKLFTNELSSTLTYDINAKGLGALTLSLKYKGAGSVSATLYDYNEATNSLVANSDVTVRSGTLNKTEYTEYTCSINPTSLTSKLTIQVYTESASGFYVDDLYLGKSITKDARSSSYSFTLEDGSPKDTGWGAIDAMSFTNDENQTWKTPFGRYAENASGYKGLYVAQVDNILNNTEELTPEYNAIRECIINDGLYTGTYHMTNILFMTFDIDYFEDITFNFISLAGTSWQRMSIMYSIDEGTSWHGLSTFRNINLTDNGEGYYRYSINGDKSMLRATDSVYSKIRFGFVGTTWAETSYFVSSVVINNKNDFKNRLDSEYGNDICSAAIGARNLIKKEYTLLNESDYAELENTPMKLNPSLDYISGYNYHLARWDSASLSSLNKIIVNDSKDYMILIITIITFISSIASFVYINKRRNRKFN